MCSRTAPLFRSWMVKRSSGNSCIAEERWNVTVTTRQRHDSKKTCPPARPRRSLGCPVGSEGLHWIHLVTAPMGVLFLLFLFRLFSLDYLIEQKCVVYLKFRAPQPEGVKRKWNNSLWSSAKNSWKLRTSRALNFQSAEMALNTFWKSSPACSMSHHSATNDFITIHGRSGKKKKKNENSQPWHLLKNWCKSLGYIKSLKSYRIKASRQKNLPCWGLVIHHPELQLEHGVVMVPPYGSDLWEHNRTTVHLAGGRSGPPTWRDPASVAGGLCPTCPCHTS